MPFASSRYYNDVNLGNVFIGSTAIAGVLLPAYNATAHTFCVWNPLGSGKLCNLLFCSLGWVSTTGAPGNVVLSYQTGVGSQVATGAAITAATLVAPINAKLGGGATSVSKFAPATITFATATSLLMPLGISQLTTTGATTSSPMWEAYVDLQGLVTLGQGSAVCVAGNIALLSLFDITMIWEEVVGS
jgi:hypothetical protein